MQEEKPKETKQFQPGIRFYPTEEELVSFYLNNKLEEKKVADLDRVIPVINIYEYEPWLLPKLSGELCHGDTEQWFFFVPRQEREARGGRPKRTTASGYWKATGSPSYVYSSENRVIGVKKSMVFYSGKAPTGRKTTWKMNEYRAIIEQQMLSSSTQAIPKLRHELSLCRVYIISGSFRAFDRRPLGIVTRGEMTGESASKNTNCSLFSSQTTKMVERRSSPESSSSAKDTHFDHMGNEGSSNTWEMPDGLEGLWD